MLTITQLEPFEKGRRKIYLNDEFAFVLYYADMKKLESSYEDFSFSIGTVMPEHIYREILDGILTKRAKLRAMNLLKRNDKTRQQLTDKLREGLYPEEVVNRAVDYVCSYGYVDDSRYAHDYASFRMKTKSRRQIENELIQKGVCSEIITASLDEVYGESELDEADVIRSLAVKKLGRTLAPGGELPDSLEYDTLQKLYRHLVSKGFSFDKVKHALDITYFMP